MSGWSKHISLLPHIPSGWSELWLIIAESGVVWTTEARREGLTLTHTRTAESGTSLSLLRQLELWAGTGIYKHWEKEEERAGKQGSICGSPVGLSSLEPVGSEINAMGNSNSKKKTQANLTSSYRTSRVKSIWHFRHVDKFKTGRKRWEMLHFAIHKVFSIARLRYCE